MTGIKKFTGKDKLHAPQTILRAQYMPYIDKLVKERFGKGQDVNPLWRKTYPITEGLELFCITYSEKFIIDLCMTEPRYKNLDFLNAFADEIANYLGVFFARIERFPDKASAHKHIHKLLYQDFYFVRSILKPKKKQVQNNAPIPRKRPDNYYQKIEDRHMRKDVLAIFNEVQSIRTSTRSINRFHNGKKR